MIHRTAARIYYEDTDCGGVVYYGNYFRYFERARTHFLEDLGFDLSRLMAEGTLFVAVSAAIDYKASARYGDTLLIESRIVELGAASLTFSHRVIRESDGALIVSSTVRLACVDQGGKVRRLGKAEREALKLSLDAATQNQESEA